MAKNRAEKSGTKAGLIGGAITGAMFGCRLGIAGGPMGAVNGAIPGAVIGGLVGALAGNRVGHELDHSSADVAKTVTYSDVIEYFVKNQPVTPGAAKGALMRKSEGSQVRLTWLFLDANNEPVKRKNGTLYGKEVLAKGIDEDLALFFDDKSVVVFE